VFTPSDNAALASRMREAAREIFQHALSEASITRAFEKHVYLERGVLRICEDLYDLSSYPRTVIISFGKAGHSMVEALRSQTGEWGEGIVAAPSEAGAQLRGFRYFRGGHPTPNAESLRAADAVLRTLDGLNAASLVLFMISGGGSSIVEKPIDDEISLDDLVGTYRALVLSGAPIAEINAIRKHLSAVKGGRLAQAAGAAQQVSLLISDVPEHTPDALASGPTMPDSTSVEDCYAIARKHGLIMQFPDPVRQLFEKRSLEETPKSDDPVFHRSRWWTLLSNQTAVAAAAEAATRAGFAVEIDNRCDDWEYGRAAGYLLGRLRELRKGVARVCLISGGEVTVKVSGDGGTGGRNQQFALACAEEIAGENITVLSAGTDGIDGNSPAAGAIADGTTAERARAMGLSLRDARERFDAFPLFQALGDALIIGPTGNNVRDLRILLGY
jgi:hydroxypyruvate reductase